MTYAIRTFLLLLLVAQLFRSVELHAEELQLNELQLKPAIVYNIARYVTWPVSTNASHLEFTIGIYGQGRNTSMWNSLNGKSLQGRKISVRRFSDLDEIVNCNLLLIESSERKNILRILAAVKDYPVLTISEIDGFSHNGGMFTLHVINNRMAFEINLKSARASGLTISSNILKLAIEVLQ